jgi:hypothetical protein
MSEQLTLWDTDNATSSPGSADGASPCASPDGRTIGRSGQAHVPVSRFRSLDADKAMPTDATCGPIFTASSPSTSLQLSLESRLRAKMDVVPQVAAAFIAAYCDAVIRNAPRHRLMIERSRRAAKRHKTRVCVMCGSGFTTTRTDAGYCSNVCRQAAYRRSAKPRSSGSGAVDGDEQRRVVLALMRAPYP